ncbi:hypothetical protein NHX12_029681 [Muraenolepis orangiensis]|uniref:Uncharacterized protein n=1 Tax=Muraenolepis orangiensis TaxID=630683 RepID=A0A9Q0E778_9TELE|nr:hypothetical protein NHX12_029681 [Muraenolepis orangiensis]
MRGGAGGASQRRLSQVPGPSARPCVFLRDTKNKRRKTRTADDETQRVNKKSPESLLPGRRFLRRFEEPLLSACSVHHLIPIWHGAPERMRSSGIT